MLVSDSGRKREEPPGRTGGPTIVVVLSGSGDGVKESVVRGRTGPYSCGHVDDGPNHFSLTKKDMFRGTSRTVVQRRRPAVDIRSASRSRAGLRQTWSRGARSEVHEERSRGLPPTLDRSESVEVGGQTLNGNFELALSILILRSLQLFWERVCRCACG
jgi:hypothetical protein